MKLKKLRAERNELATKMSALADKENPTDEDNLSFDIAAEEFEKADANVKRAEKVAAAKARLDEPRPSAGAMQAVDPSTVAIPAGPEAKQKFECFEEFLCAVVMARTNQGTDQRLEFKAIDLRSEQSMGVGTKGGFMVPAEFRAELLAVDPAQTPLLANARRLPPGASPDAAVTLPALDQDTNQHGGVTVARIGEGVAKPETDADLKQVTWTPTEIAAHIALTDQLIRNWSGAMGFAQGLLGSALNAALEAEAYNGNGVAQMLGVLQSGAAYDVARETALDFTLQDVARMASRKLQRGAAGFWLYNPLLLANLMQMKDGNNNLVWQSNVVEGSPGSIWGMPAFPYEFAAAVGSRGDVCLVQPNPYYIIKEGSGPFVDTGYINTDFTTNRTRVKIFTMNDGGPWLQSPFKLQNGSEVSPFVVLDVP